MDPPHITEFASKRYFSKLNQLNESGSQPENGPITGYQGPALHPAPLNSLALPLRPTKSLDPGVDASRATEQKRQEKSRFLSFRSKVSSFQSKPPPVPDLPPQYLPTPPRSESPKPRRSILPLDQLFLGLPNELQIQIITSLPLADILNLRLASKSWHTLITLNEAPIVRYHLDHHIPPYALRLYPASDPSTVSFHHLCGLWHRLHVATKLSFLMCEWITKGLFLRETEAQRLDFAPQRDRMHRRLVPLLFTIFHFFEMYRKFHLQHLRDHDGHGILHEPYTLNPIEVKIMSMYDDQTLLKVHEVFPLVISSFCRRLRPPSYVGRVERSLRGYLKDKPPDEVQVAILCIGGLRLVERLWEIKGYNTRRGEVDAWYTIITKDPVIESPPSKAKRSLLGLGRKKSIATLKDAGRCTSNESHPWTAAAVPLGGHGHQLGLVFNTSLAAGMPMAPLDRESARPLLADLPCLQEIWTRTAEAVILDRKIVDRSQDIKRNAQIMLELIREDGMEEENELWYGRNSPELLKPTLGGLDMGLGDGVTDEMA